MKKRIEHFAKTYFYFNKNEKLGIYLLLGLIVLTLCVKWSLTFLFPPKLFPLSMQTLMELDTLAAKTTHQNKFVYHTFDTVYKQRQFKKKFPNPGFVKYRHDTVYPVHKKKLEIIVELNNADSVSLVNLYRIGPILASKIISYRNKLGGFINLNQLTEIRGFDADILYDLQGKILIDETRSKKYNLNTVSLEELKQHPYFKNNLSQAIVNYRTQHGKYHSFSDLRKIKLVNDSILERIRPYTLIE
ncbi:MAG: helix-hairpin-helix domain-containing protein [Bacteroidia bacterium]|nr:helix-hairpin-helix domain-containing protein [Bacteroidia bacterium]